MLEQVELEQILILLGQQQHLLEIMDFMQAVAEAQLSLLMEAQVAQAVVVLVDLEMHLLLAKEEMD